MRYYTIELIGQPRRVTMRLFHEQPLLPRMGEWVVASDAVSLPEVLVTGIGAAFTA